MNSEGFEMERRVLRGEHPVYPGHPVVVGLLIMEAYPDLDAALETMERGWPRALGDGRIPGAGSEVYSALYLLKDTRDGVRTVEESVEFARERWHAGGIEKNVVPGQEQADRFADDYVRRAQEWLAPTAAPEP